MGDSTQEKTAYYDLQERVMKAMGYKIVQIPHWHWSRITHTKVRSDYCQMNRHLAIQDTREGIARSESDSNRDPTRFAAREAALNHSTAFAFHGEYFFAKEQPKRAWAWHGQPSTPVKVTL